MRPSNLVAPLAAMLLGAGGVAHAAEVLKTDNARMDVGGRLQLLGFAQKLEDGARDNERLYLFLKQGRLNLSGNVDAWRYQVMIAFGGEEEIKAPTPGISLSLLDMYVDVPISFLGNTYVRVGQFKVPYSRERLTESGTLFFADRSVQNLAFRVGRDVGATLYTQAGPWRRASASSRAEAGTSPSATCRRRSAPRWWRCARASTAAWVRTSSRHG
ncbi:MAG TPA: porin [Archangium sp.]|nr:porin [Archangium sp.]